MSGNIVNTGISKIDDKPVNGLLGAQNSLSYKVEEIEKHLHNREKWFGAAAAPVDETHIADRLGGSTSAFTVTAGNNDFGAWIQVLGSSDTPVQSGMTQLDAHRFMVTSTNSTSPYIIQIAAGESAQLAALVAAEAFTEVPYVAATNNNDSGISDVMSSRIPVGSKIWVRCACVGQNGTTITAYYGIHEYQG
jgi:hypothetical protein